MKNEAKVRHSAKRIALYNHKGGVGKTTLTLNIATALAARGNKVLLVDADPQCNLTSYLVQADVIDEWLENSDLDNGRTIWSALKPFMDSSGDIRQIEPVERLDGIYLVPGDIRLSEFEQDLNQTWTDCLQRKIRGYKGVTAISEIVNSICLSNNIDYVFYDIGPNIGPLNKVVILDCDYFIVPAACDLFSVRALKTLGHSLYDWISDWNIIAQLAPDNTFLLPGRPKFLGYILQKFRIYGGEIASQFSTYAAKLEKSAYSDITVILRKIDKNLAPLSLQQNKLGQIKDFGALASKSQEQGEPFSKVEGGDSYQKDQARHAFDQIAAKIISSIAAEA